MGKSWWGEIAPTTECQRIARVAMMAVTEGMTDQSAGTDTMDYVTYKRRRGMGWANRTYADTQNISFSTPVISSAGRRIDFKLETDPTASNVRRYYLAQDANGVRGVYYQYGDSSPQLVNGTAGISDIVFEMMSGYSNLIKITVTAQKQAQTMRNVAYPVTTIYDDYIFLRNI